MLQGAVLGLLAATASYLATTQPAAAGIMLAAMRSENLPSTIMVFIVGIIVGALIVYFLRRGR